MDKEKWQVHSNILITGDNGGGSKTVYRIGRRINRCQPLHSGNVEYVGEWNEDFEGTLERCEELNRKEGFTT